MTTERKIIAGVAVVAVGAYVWKRMKDKKDAAIDQRVQDVAEINRPSDAHGDLYVGPFNQDGSGVFNNLDDEERAAFAGPGGLAFSGSAAGFGGG